MQFKDVIDAAESGSKIRRRCWHEDEYIQNIGGEMEWPNGNAFKGFAESIFAKDWEIVREIEYMSFCQAADKIKIGETMKRKDWGNNEFFYCNQENQLEYMNGRDQEFLGVEDYTAKDWY